MSTHLISTLLAAAEGADDLAINLRDLLVIAVIAAAVPMIVGLLRLRIAEVVLLLGLGVLVGPSVLGWVTVNSTMDTFNEVGLGLLFFLAGYELEQRAITGAPGKLAAIGWLTSLCLAFIVSAVMWKTGFIADLTGIAIALTSTALEPPPPPP